VAVVHNKKGAKKNLLRFQKFTKGKKRKIYRKKKKRNLRFKKGRQKKKGKKKQNRPLWPGSEPRSQSQKLKINDGK